MHNLNNNIIAQCIDFSFFFFFKSVYLEGKEVLLTPNNLNNI